MELEKQYPYIEVQEKWYPHWEQAGHFRCDENDHDREPYCIMIPPPNVTSVLHMGHALNSTIQDILIRWKRMQGFNTLWQPGSDHAGIATQNVVERQLKKEGTSRHELGREKTVERIWDWVDHYGGAIVGQLKALGCSCDWERSRFTLDEGLSKAVREVFVRLYEKGWVYRGKRIINWCPRCTTALSDEESPKLDKKGHMWHFTYPLADGSGGITIATTRPETLLGDTAVAVHPDDERYKSLIGKMLKLPVLGREIPIVADTYVDKDFGSGAVKVTPAHDPNDFEIGKRHDLAQIVIMDESGVMNENAGPYQGLDRFEARKKLVADLDEQGVLDHVDDHELTVPHCDRCNTVVEPYLSEQWFVKMDDMARPAIEVVKSKEIQFVPPRWEKVYLDWMENIRDWCISRQLWWGHQIPAWTCEGCSEIIVTREDPTACPKCGGKELERDPDVLDTWFSSWLWPFSTLGWPDTESQTLKTFYPTDVLSTDKSIIFFWVARMVMAGLEFHGEIPFKYINIHATVLDAQGRKMSKSAGNGIDPLDLIAKYGTDAVRFSLMIMTKEGQDLKLSEQKIEMGRNFTNKIWNATRFMLMNLESAEDLGSLDTVERDEDRWILSRLNSTVKNATADLDGIGFHGYCTRMYAFFWNDLCDWYIEIVKDRLSADADAASRKQAQQVLYHVLETSLRLLHPVIPFITEELWQHVTALQTTANADRSIMLAEWPTADGDRIDAEFEKEFEMIIKKVVPDLRSYCSSRGTTLSDRVHLSISHSDPEIIEGLNRNKKLLSFCLNSVEINILDAPLTKVTNLNMFPVPSGTFSVVAGFCEDVGIDRDSERTKFERYSKIREKAIDGLRKKLSNSKFCENAKEDVIANEKERLELLKEEVSNTKRALGLLDTSHLDSSKD